MGRDRTSEYKAKVHRWARLPVPFWFGKGRDGPERQTAQAWMVRNDVSETEVRSAAFTSMVTLAVVSGSMSAVLYLLLPTQQLLFAGLGLAMLPLMTAMSLLSFPFQRASEEERAMMRESPGVIGALSMSINVRPSLEAAVSFAAHGDGLLCHRLRASWWESISGRRASLEMSVMDMAASLGEMNESLRQAIILTIASTKQGTRSGIDRLLDLANRVVLDGIREKGDRYVASLSVPTMVLFAFGVLLPVMLFSLMPLLSMTASPGSAAFAPPPLSVPMVALLMLVIFPTCTFTYAHGILRRHPLGGPSSLGQALDRKDIGVMIGLIAISLVISSLFTDQGPALGLLFLSWSLSFWFLRRLHRWHLKERRRPRLEREMVLALFQIGNHLASGASFETALTELAQCREGEVRELCRRVLHRMRCDRATASQIVEMDPLLLAVSPMLRHSFVTVVQCAMVDPRAAMRTALNLAQYLSDLQTTESKVKERLQGVVDMMSYTATFFAPIVLAVTASLFQIVSVLTGTGEGQEGLFLIGGIYSLELCAIVAYFNHMMIGANGQSGAVYGFARRAPLAVTTYVVVFMLAQVGLTMIA